MKQSPPGLCHPVSGSQLEGIQIAQINDVEFLEFWIQTKCSLQPSSTHSRPILKRRLAHTFIYLFFRASHCQSVGITQRGDL